MASTLFLWFAVFLRCTTFVRSLGTACSTAVTSGTAAATDPYWLQDITHQGTAAYNTDPSTYPVFRNVMDYGAKGVFIQGKPISLLTLILEQGDGVTDDTAAIKWVQFSQPEQRNTYW